jgi:hypothetical protein
MEVSVCRFGVPHVGKVAGVVGVVVAVDEPNPIPNGLKLDVQRPSGLEVAQQNHSPSAGFQRGLGDVLPLAVGVAAEKERTGLHVGLLNKNEVLALCRAMPVFFGKWLAKPEKQDVGPLAPSL